MKKSVVVIVALLVGNAVLGDKVAVSTTSGSISYQGIGSGTAISTVHFTIEAWVKPTEVRAEMPIVSQYPGSGRIVFGLRTKSDDKTKAVLGFFVGDYSKWQTSGHIIPLNEWTHVAVSRTTNSFTLYADGEAVYTYSYPKEYDIPTPGPIHPLTVGGYRSSLYSAITESFIGYNTFPGSIADVRVWNYARTQTEIATDRGRRLTGGEAGLIAYWPLNESLGNTTPEYVMGSDALVTDIWSIQEDDTFALSPAIGLRAPSPAWPVFSGFSADKKPLATKLKLAPQTDFTFEVWVNVTNEAAITENRIVAQYSQVKGDKEGCMLFELYNGKPALFQGNSSPNRPMTDEPLPLNVWTHVACVRKFEEKRVLFYTNGVLASSHDITKLCSLPANTNIFVFGGTLVDPHFVGCLRDLRIWNTARTAEEIAANFQRELMGDEPGLFACWPLDDGGRTFHEIVEDKRYDWSVSGFDWLSSGDTGSTVPYRRRSEGNKVIQPCFGGDASTGGDTGMIIPTNTTAYTLEAWVCPTGVGRMLANAENKILMQYVPGDSGRLLFGLSKNRLFLLQGPVNHKSADGIRVDGSTWSHVAVVRDGRSISFYINGENVENFNVSDSGRLSDTNLFIGNRLGTFSFSGEYSSFNGGLREVRVWTVARTGEEIKRNFNRKLTGDEAGLFGYWPIDSITDIKTLENRRGGAADGVMRALLLPLPPFPVLKGARTGCVIILR